MKLQIDRPDITCWLLIPPIALFALVSRGKVLEFQSYDTFYGIQYWVIAGVYILILAFSAFIYRLAIKKMNYPKNLLIFGHLILSIIGLFFLLKFFSSTSGFGVPDSDKVSLSIRYINMVLIVVGVISCIVDLLLLVVNLVLALIKKLN